MTKIQNYIFFGTPNFAAIILDKLINSDFVPLAVVTNPDRPVGRKKILTPPPLLKQLLLSRFNDRRNGIVTEILQPENLDQEFIKKLKDLKPNFGVLAAYGKIIPKEIIDIFPKGIIVVHPSLLPKYRGATPIQSAILAGEQKMGTTLFLMDEKIDHGPILASSQLSSSQDDNFKTLSGKLAELSADLLIKILPDYLMGKIKPKEQDHSRATFTKKFTTEDGLIELEKNSPEEIWRKVRAFNPEPGVFTFKNGKRMKILEADLVDGELVLKKVQMDGEKPKSLSE